MPRFSRSQNRQVDDMQRGVITVKPQTMTGGFLPLAALAPFAAAAGIPLASSAGKWIGKKLFGQGIRQAGAGILRAGERPIRAMHGGSSGGGFRAGDYKMASMAPLPNYQTGTSAGMQGGMLLNMPGVPETVKKAIRTIGTVGGKKKKSTKGCGSKKKH